MTGFCGCLPNLPTNRHGEEELEIMPFCTNCGAKSPDDALFCPCCGTRMSPHPADEQARNKKEVILHEDLLNARSLAEIGDEAANGEVPDYATAANKYRQALEAVVCAVLDVCSFSADDVRCYLSSDEKMDTGRSRLDTNTKLAFCEKANLLNAAELAWANTIRFVGNKGSHYGDDSPRPKDISKAQFAIESLLRAVEGKIGAWASDDACVPEIQRKVFSECYKNAAQAGDFDAQRYTRGAPGVNLKRIVYGGHASSAKNAAVDDMLARFESQADMRAARKSEMAQQEAKINEIKRNRPAQSWREADELRRSVSDLGEVVRELDANIVRSASELDVEFARIRMLYGKEAVADLIDRANAAACRAGLGGKRFKVGLFPGGEGTRPYDQHGCLVALYVGIVVFAFIFLLSCLRAG